MRRLSIAAIALLFSPSAFAANDIIFYEGNNCTQDVVFRYDSAFSYDENCTRPGNRCYRENDEARSVRIYRSVRLPLQIAVFDSPTGATNDDYTNIFVSRIAFAGSSYCIRTFEQSRGGSLDPTAPLPWLKMFYKRKNGLDGKVSRVKIHH